MKIGKISCILALFFITSCFNGRTKPSNFYNIIPVEDYNIKIKTKNKLMIGVDVVNIAGYIDRPEIVTIKNSPMELNISNFDRWAEPLSNSIQRVIANNIEFYIKNSLVRPLKTYRKGFDYMVYININRLEGKFNEKAFIDINYSIINSEGKNVFNKRYTSELKIMNSYEDLVEKYNMLIAQLSIEIAESISKL